MSRGSYYFPSANSAFISFAGNSRYSITSSTRPFTVEAWLFPNSSGGRIISEQLTAAGNSVSLVCGLCNGTAVNNDGLFPGFGWYTGSAWVTAAASSLAISLNTWTHVAWVFTGSTSKIYINGLDYTKSATPTPATTWGITGVAGDNWYIGRKYDTTAGGTYFDGYMYNVRWVNGTAVYTANFTPSTTTLTDQTDTVIFTCNSSKFTIVDTGPFAVPLTNSGNVSNSLFMPDNVSYLGDAVIASEEFNSIEVLNRGKGSWSVVEIGPKY